LSPGFLGAHHIEVTFRILDSFFAKPIAFVVRRLGGIVGGDGAFFKASSPGGYQAGNEVRDTRPARARVSQEHTASKLLFGFETPFLQSPSPLLPGMGICRPEKWLFFKARRFAKRSRLAPGPFRDLTRFAGFGFETPFFKAQSGRYAGADIFQSNPVRTVASPVPAVVTPKSTQPQARFADRALGLSVRFQEFRAKERARFSCDRWMTK
jgi:hypothetical protein